jgi:hypothetical protein
VWRSPIENDDGAASRQDLQSPQLGWNSRQTYDNPGTIMEPKTFMRLAVLTLTMLSLGGCANLERHHPNAMSQADDDAYCQANGGPQGSAAYTACRKDRDVAATRSDRMERTHRDLAERMLNGQ